MAHHSFAAEYDRNKPVTLTGTVMRAVSNGVGRWLESYLDSTEVKRRRAAKSAAASPKR